MCQNKAKEIISLIKDLPYSDWCKIRHCVDKAFDAVRNRAQLSDTASLETFFKQEFDLDCDNLNH